MMRSVLPFTHLFRQKSSLNPPINVVTTYWKGEQEGGEIWWVEMGQITHEGRRFVFRRILSLIAGDLTKTIDRVVKLEAWELRMSRTGNNWRNFPEDDLHIRQTKKNVWLRSHSRSEQSVIFVFQGSSCSDRSVYLWGECKMEAETKHEFQATADDELSFKKGTILKVNERQEAFHVGSPFLNIFT